MVSEHPKYDNRALLHIHVEPGVHFGEAFGPTEKNNDREHVSGHVPKRFRS